MRFLISFYEVMPKHQKTGLPAGNLKKIEKIAIKSIFDFDVFPTRHYLPLN